MYITVKDFLDKFLFAPERSKNEQIELKDMITDCILIPSSLMISENDFKDWNKKTVISFGIEHDMIKIECCNVPFDGPYTNCT